jgi:energy-converting hydrogenase B subunit D
MTELAMNVLLIVSLTLVALAGAAVVLANAPERQAVTLAFFGLTLTVLFVALEAPDVALSQLGVGTAIVPLMVMLTIRTMRGERKRKDSK